MTNRLLIFDFDGTIADTFHFILELSNRWAHQYKYKEVQPHEIEHMKNKNTREVIQHLGVPIMKIPMIVARAKEALQDEITQIEPIEGLKKILEEMRRSEIKMGILTSNAYNNVVKFLKHHDMELFDFINSTSKIWSKNTAIKQIIKHHKMNPLHTVYIGDETRDIVAAQKAGVKIAAVTWGYNSEQALLENNPDYLFRTPADLIELCQTH